jgi:uncharacterized membrane protein YbhN (UPF0104 family)
MGMGADQKRRPVLSALRALVALSAVAYVGYALWQRWPELTALRLNGLWLGVAVASIGVAFAGQVAAWQWNLARLGVRLSYGPLFRVYFTMNMARYIPGKIWSVAGMVAGGVRLGVDPLHMSISVVLGLVSSLVSGVLVGFGVAWWSGYELLLNPWFLMVPAGTLLVLIPPVYRMWFGWLWRRWKGDAEVPVIPHTLLARSIVHYGLVWAAYGTAVGAMAQAVGSDAFTLFFAAFPLAYLAGYAALFAPGGWGVREGALVMLGGGGSVALAVALLQRILLTAGEVTLFAYAVWSGRDD